jgi:4-coumarate--CoA ligase (photoactive yellow protein activation family)
MREGDRVVAIPEIWKLLIGRPCADRVHGISSTAPLPADVASEVRRRGVCLIEVYGSTESAGVGYRSETAAPYTLLPYWERVAMAGEQRGETGLERPAVADPILPPDHFRWVGERHFVPVGRRDEMVQVGGYNVSPTTIARRIEALESVKECAVRLMQEHEGERLKAVVVPANPEHDPAELRREVETWAVSHLAAHERPGHILVADRLPRNEMGKLADWPLPTPTTLR